MKKVIMLYALLLVTVTGCIKENLDDCETILYFDYLGDGTRDIFLQKIEKVDMYVYNEDKVCIQKTALNKSELHRQQGTTLNLPSGQYHVVCWGNSFGDTRINEGASLNNNLVGAPHYFTKELITTNDSLYFGEKEITITNENYKVDTVPFSSTYKDACRIGRTGCRQCTDGHLTRQHGNGKLESDSEFHQVVFKRTNLLFSFG